MSENLRKEAEIEFSRRQEIIMDDEDAAYVDQDSAVLRRLDEHWLRGLRVLLAYKGNRDMALDCFALAHGLGEMIGMHSAVEIAVKHFADKKKKAAVTKCVQMFRDCLNLPPAPGQRSERGRKAMADARKKQLDSK